MANQGLKSQPIHIPNFTQTRLLLFWPVYLTVFFITERLVTPDAFHVMYHPADALIPFREGFLIPYCFWYIYMVGSIAYTLFKDPNAFRRQAWFMIITFGSASVFFLLYPSCQMLRPETFPRDNLLTRGVQLMYLVDTSTNVCPSLHVCGSVGCALGLCDTKQFSSPLWKLCHILIAAFITVSTVFIKQHSVVDVFWGLMLSLVAYLIVYRLCPLKHHLVSFHKM